MKVYSIENLLSVEDDEEFKKLSNLPKYLFFDIGRYLKLIDANLNGFGSEEIKKNVIAKAIELALEYYIEPHEASEGIEDAVTEALIESTERNKGIVGEHFAQEIEKIHIKSSTTIIGVMVDDLVACLVNNDIPAINEVSCLYQLDCIDNGVVVLERAIKIGRF